MPLQRYRTNAAAIQVVRTEEVAQATFPNRFRAMIQEVHGFDLAPAPPPDVRLISDTRF